MAQQAWIEKKSQDSLAIEAAAAKQQRKHTSSSVGAALWRSLSARYRLPEK